MFAFCIFVLVELPYLTKQRINPINCIHLTNNIPINDTRVSYDCHHFDRDVVCPCISRTHSNNSASTSEFLFFSFRCLACDFGRSVRSHASATSIAVFIHGGAGGENVVGKIMVCGGSLVTAGATEINTLGGEYEQPAPGNMSKEQEMVSHRRAHKLGAMKALDVV